MTRARYDPETPCPKCGCKEEADTKFCNGNCYCLRFPLEKGEHIDRRCRNCGYVWAEECLDKEEE